MGIEMWSSTQTKLISYQRRAAAWFHCLWRNTRSRNQDPLVPTVPSETLILLNPEKYHFIHGGEQVAHTTELGITFNLIVNCNLNVVYKFEFNCSLIHISLLWKRLTGEPKCILEDKVVLNEKERIWEINFCTSMYCPFAGPMILYQHGNMEI